MDDDGETKLSPYIYRGPWWVERLARPAIGVASLLLFGVAINFGIRENVAGVAVASTPAVLTLIFVFLPYFSEFTIMGFKAKLLDQKIHEADAALRHIKSLAVVVAKEAYQTLTYGNRMASIPATSRWEVSSAIDGILRDLSIDRGLLQTERSQFLRSQLFDIANFVHQTMQIGALQIQNKGAAAGMTSGWPEFVAALHKLNREDRVGQLWGSGDVDNYFASLLGGLNAIDFSVAPTEKNRFVSLISEAQQIANDIQQADALTDRGRDYLTACLAESAERYAQKWASLT